MARTNTELALALARGKRADVEEPEWDVRITFDDGSVEWFIFQKVDAPTVPDVLKLVERETNDPETHVRKLVISSVKGKRNGKAAGQEAEEPQQR